METKVKQSQIALRALHSKDAIPYERRTNDKAPTDYRSRYFDDVLRYTDSSKVNQQYAY